MYDTLYSYLRLINSQVWICQESLFGQFGYLFSVRVKHQDIEPIHKKH